MLGGKYEISHVPNGKLNNGISPDSFFKYEVRSDVSEDRGF